MRYPSNMILNELIKFVQHDENANMQALLRTIEFEMKRKGIKELEMEFEQLESQFYAIQEENEDLEAQITNLQNELHEKNTNGTAWSIKS